MTFKNSYRTKQLIIKRYCIINTRFIYFKSNITYIFIDNKLTSFWDISYFYKEILTLVKYRVFQLKKSIHIKLVFFVSKNQVDNRIIDISFNNYVCE